MGQLGSYTDFFLIEFLSLPSLEVHELYGALMVCDADAKQIAKSLLLIN